MESFSLENVKGDVKVQKATTLPPFSTAFIMFSCWYRFKRKVYLGLVQTWCLESNKTIVMCVLFI